MKNASIENFKIAPGFLVIQKIEEDTSQRKTKSGLFIAGDNNELKTGRILAVSETWTFATEQPFLLSEGDYVVYSSLTLGKCPFSFFDSTDETQEIDGYILPVKNVVFSYKKVEHVQ